MRPLRLFGSLVLVGYLAVIAGTVSWIIAFGNYHQKAFLASEIAMTIAYGLVGVGCWRVLRACRNDDASARMMRVLTRWVASASGVMAVAFAFSTYEYHKTHSSIVALGGR